MEYVRTIAPQLNNLLILLKIYQAYGAWTDFLQVNIVKFAFELFYLLYNQFSVFI